MINHKNRGFYTFSVKLSILFILLVSIKINANESFKSLMMKIDDAYFNQNVQVLKDNLRLNLAGVKIDVTWHNYIHALIYYRMATINLNKSKSEQADTYLDKALLLINKVNSNQNKADYMALKSSVIGLKISIKPFPRGMQLGESSNKAKAFAMKNKPNDMRVLLFSGISLFNTPHLYGGDKKIALEKFKQAFELSSKITKPYWGKWDTFYWYAIALRQQDKKEYAFDIIKQLLAKYPKNKQFKKMLDN